MVIKKFIDPTHLDVYPFLTEWHHELEDGSIKIWVQCNELVDDNTKPHWIRLGDLMEKVWADQPGWWTKMKIDIADFIPDSFFVYMRNKEM